MRPSPSARRGAGPGSGSRRNTRSGRCRSPPGGHAPAAARTGVRPGRRRRQARRARGTAAGCRWRRSEAGAAGPDPNKNPRGRRRQQLSRRQLCGTGQSDQCNDMRTQKSRRTRRCPAADQCGLRGDGRRAAAAEAQSAADEAEAEAADHKFLDAGSGTAPPETPSSSENGGTPFGVPCARNDSVALVPSATKMNFSLIQPLKPWLGLL